MFKYFPPERLDVLKNNLICFNNPMNFNDPFEFHTLFNLDDFDKKMFNELSDVNLLRVLPPEYSIIINMLDPISRCSIISRADSVLPDFYGTYKNKIIEQVNASLLTFTTKFIDATRVLSLTTDPRNILMWGHYAHSHSGFVIEFDKHHDFFNQKRSDKDEYGFLREIIYQDELPNLNPLGGSPVNYFFVKSNDWKYEKEWRMLLPEYNSVEKKYFPGKYLTCFSYRQVQ